LKDDLGFEWDRFVRRFEDDGESGVIVGIGEGIFEIDYDGGEGCSNLVGFFAVVKGGETDPEVTEFTSSVNRKGLRAIGEKVFIAGEGGNDGGGECGKVGNRFAAKDAFDGTGGDEDGRVAVEAAEAVGSAVDNTDWSDGYGEWFAGAGAGWYFAGDVGVVAADEEDSAFGDETELTLEAENTLEGIGVGGDFDITFH